MILTPRSPCSKVWSRFVVILSLANLLESEVGHIVRLVAFRACLKSNLLKVFFVGPTGPEAVPSANSMLHCVMLLLSPQMNND